MADRRELYWHTFTKLPPMKENILVWRGLQDCDGGFPLIGRLYQDSIDGEYYICYKPGYTSFWPVGYIGEDEFKYCRWALIPRPAVAQRKWERDREICRKNLEQKRQR